MSKVQIVFCRQVQELNRGFEVSIFILWCICLLFNTFYSLTYLSGPVLGRGVF